MRGNGVWQPGKYSSSSPAQPQSPEPNAGSLNAMQTKTVTKGGRKGGGWRQGWDWRLLLGTDLVHSQQYGATAQGREAALQATATAATRAGTQKGDGSLPEGVNVAEIQGAEEKGLPVQQTLPASPRPAARSWSH